jgi:hypothetical protein
MWLVTGRDIILIFLGDFGSRDYFIIIYYGTRHHMRDDVNRY